MATKEIAKAVYGAIRPRLEQLGFKRRAGDIYLKEIAPEVYGWIGFSQSTDRATGAVYFAPTVGVAFYVLEQLVAELQERKFEKYDVHTIGTPLGSVMPERRYLRWMVSSPDEGYAEQVAIGIVERIEYYGLPYMERYKSLREAISQMSPEYLGGGNPPGWKPLVVAYAMVGERDKAFEVLDHWMAKEEGKPTWLKKVDAAFDRKFRARIDSIPVIES